MKSTEVLIIGGGSAGCSAAHAISDLKSDKFNVTIVDNAAE